MNIDDVIFIDSLPKIDLHSLDRETARVFINDFINDSIKQKKSLVCIIHGNGSGILKETTKATLKKNKNVLEFKSFYNNMGCTIVKIRI